MWCGVNYFDLCRTLSSCTFPLIAANASQKLQKMTVGCDDSDKQEREQKEKVSPENEPDRKRDIKKFSNTNEPNALGSKNQNRKKDEE